jgi:predicted amino acid dehydrogenase
VTKKLVSISLGPARLDYEFDAQLWGETFQIRRLGTDGDTARARRLVREHDGQVDCIALGGMSISFTVGKRTWRHKETYRIASAARTTPVVGGRALKRIVDRWAIRDIASRKPDLFADRSVLFLSGIANWDLVEVLREHTDTIVFGDPVLHYGVPTILRDVEALERYARIAMPFLTRRPYVSFFPRGKAAEGIQTRELTRFFQRADVIVGDLRLLVHHSPRDLTHKVIVTDSIGPDTLKFFRDRDVETLCTTTPQVFGEHRADLQILHAACIAHLDKDPHSIDEQDYLMLLRQLKARPRLIHPRGEVRKRHKFAYLYYPPGRRDLFRDPRLRWLRTLPDGVQTLAERVLRKLPVRPTGHIRGIVSPTGEEAEGWILEIAETARSIQSRGEDYAAGRLTEATRLASRLGAEVMGVGAFAQCMSDATTQVAARIDLPITNGGSYLVSTDMWAAKQAIIAMGLIEQDDQGRAMGTAMVIGAGSAVGSVAAELLALVFLRLVIVDREPDRLLALTDRIALHSPHCTVEVTTRTATHLAEADLIVAGLSPGWVGTVDLANTVKPGAVLMDCARPSEFGEADAEDRPDVLIIRSGEIELPGPADLGVNLGPPAKVAFASLAEVAVLALEGRNECFTLGDNIDLDRVKEIYKLGLRNGMRLASMRGPFGPINDTEIKLVRERVEAKRRADDAPPPLEA